MASVPSRAPAAESSALRTCCLFFAVCMLFKLLLFVV